MTEPLSLLRSTQKTLHSLVAGELACRAMPYVGSLLFIELFYAVMKLSFVYGFGPGIVVGTVLFAALFSLILFSALGYDVAMLVLIFVCEAHAAMSCASVFLFFIPGGGSAPVSLVAYRAAVFPCEAAVALLAVRSLRRMR